MIFAGINMREVHCFIYLFFFCLLLIYISVLLRFRFSYQEREHHHLVLFLFVELQPPSPQASTDIWICLCRRGLHLKLHIRFKISIIQFCLALWGYFFIVIQFYNCLRCICCTEKWVLNIKHLSTATWAKRKKKTNPYSKIFFLVNYSNVPKFGRRQYNNFYMIDFRGMNIYREEFNFGFTKKL